MKKKKSNPILVVLLLALLTSCASNSTCPAFCSAYASATIDENHIELNKKLLHTINTKESNSLEAKTKEPQWADKQNLVETNYTNL
jgi:hypothetical protein